MTVFTRIAAGLALLGLLLTAPPSLAAPAGGAPVVNSGTLIPATVEGAKVNRVTVSALGAAQLPAGISHGIRVVTTTGMTADWDAVTRAPLTTAIKKGDVLLATFRARCEKSMTGEAAVQFAFERAGEPYNKSAFVRFGVREHWTVFHVPFTADDDYAPGQAHATFHLGFNGQALDLADLTVVNYRNTQTVAGLPRTDIDYPGRDADAPWRAEANARIDKHRKADLRVTVTDAAGRPVPGATAHLKQTAHAFPFGTAIAVRGLLDQGPDGERYRETLKADFNAGVLENAMKWNNHGLATDAEIAQALDWLDDAAIPLRGHVLVWPGWRWLPESIKALEHDPAALKAATEARVTNTATRYAGRLVDWDVINEPFDNHDLMDILGQEVMVDWFKLAQAADPGAQRYLNDWGILTTGGRDSAHQQHYEDTARYLIDHGAPITGLGMQGHFAGTLTSPRDVWAILDRFAQFNLPIKITELDIDLEDPVLQADFMRDLLTAAFAHESIHGVTTWGFWAKRHWRATAAHYDENWNRRPVGDVWKTLTQETWWTDATGTTDASGALTLRGFKGRHTLTVTHPDGRQSVTHDVAVQDGGGALTVTLPSP